VSGVLVVGFLGGLQVTARGCALPFCRPSVSIDVTEALLDREFFDFGGAFVCGAGLVVAPPVALVRLLVALTRTFGAIGGTLDVLLGDGLPRPKVCPPAQQLLGALGGLVAW
jgi:hypothetical protein